MDNQNQRTTEQAAFDAAIDKAYPIPDSPHTSVMQRANEARAAFTRGWQARAALTRQAAPEAPTDDAIEQAALKHVATGFKQLVAVSNIDPDYRKGEQFKRLKAFALELFGAPATQQAGAAVVCNPCTSNAVVFNESGNLNINDPAATTASAADPAMYQGIEVTTAPADGRFAAGATTASASDGPCTVPPAGWSCTRTEGHDGPCAAIPGCRICGCLPCGCTGRTPAPSKEAANCDLKTLAAFLAGVAPIEGVWFGEEHPTRPGKFWWRDFLPAFRGAAQAAHAGAAEKDAGRWRMFIEILVESGNASDAKHAEELLDKVIAGKTVSQSVIAAVAANTSPEKK